MQQRGLFSSRQSSRLGLPAATAPRCAVVRRCAVPSQDPAFPARPPPSLQSIQDGAPLPDGYQSPLTSWDSWGEEALAAKTATGTAGEDAALLEPVFDVCGVGQCLIDVNVNVSRDMLAALDVPHGGRRVIEVAERDDLLRQLEQVPSSMTEGGASSTQLSMFNLNNVTPGGSLLNTLVGLSRLGTAAAGSRPLRIAMAGCVGGDDRLGGYVRQQLRGAGVLVVKSGRGDGGAAANSSGGAPDLGAVAAALQQRFPTPGAAFAAGAQGAGPAPAAPRATTGTVMVFCTPDAQRSFLSCIPNDDAVVLTPELMHAAARSRLLVVEGYLLDLPGADAALPRLVEVAKAAGTVVALTCGDAGIVGRTADTIAACLRAGLDLVFANKGEALALTAAAPLRALLLEASRCPDAALEFCPADNSVDATMGDEDDEEEVVALPVARNAAEAADQLSRLCPMVVVTDGSKGSYVSALGATQVFPPRWSKNAPVDTCGAGDNYAAGLLYGLLQGMDVAHVGQVAAHTASRVIARHGPQLDPTDARRVVVSAARSLTDAAVGAAKAPAVGAAGGAVAGRSLMSVLEARALLAVEDARLSLDEE